MGAELTYECLGANQYVLTVSFYRDCSGISAPASATINLIAPSCGQNFSVSLPQVSSQEISALCPTALSTCQGGSQPGVEQYIYADTVSLTPCPDWTFSWSHCCRNPLITNLQAPSSQNIYVEATLDNTGNSCNSSPIFTTLSVPYICDGQPNSYNQGAIDADGDSLVYSLVNPLTTGAAPIAYQPGFNPILPISTQSGLVNFNSVTGQMDVVPNGIQVSVVAILVEEYRNGVLIGTTMRDIQVLILNCGNLQPQLDAPGITNLLGGTLLDTMSVEVCAGNNISFEVTSSDADLGDIIIMTSNAALALAGATFTSSGNNPVLGTFSWTPGVNDVGVHMFLVEISDDACPITGSRTYLLEINVINGIYAGPDKFLCLGDSVQLKVNGSGNFTWNPAFGLSNDTIANPIAFPTTTTTYIVTASMFGVCDTIDTITINVAPNFTISPNLDQIICIGGSAQLDVGTSPAGSYNYQWSPASTLNTDSIKNPIATPPSSTLYQVMVTSSLGCTKTGTTNIDIVPQTLTLNPSADNLALCLGDSTTIYANVNNPNNCNDYVLNNIVYAPVLGSGTAVALSDDQMSPAFNIGFNFPFYCGNYSQFYISSNGFITFDSSASNGCCSGQVLPFATIPNKLIAFAWEDLSPQLGGLIEYFTTGAAPNRILVVNFNDVVHFGGTDSVTSQVLLYETSGIIEIHTTAMQSDGGNHTMGIESDSGALALVVPGRNSTNWSAFNEGIQFVPDLAFLPYTITWLDPDSNVLGNDSALVVSPDSATIYTISVSNGVCNDLSQISIDVFSISAGPDQSVCAATAVQLDAVVVPSPVSIPSTCGVSSGCNGTGLDYTVGTGTSFNNATTYPAPYGNWFKNAKHQILYTVSDLLAAGVTPGTITDIGFFITSINGTTIYQAFEIKLGCTSITDITTWQSGLSTVFSPKDVNIVSGLNQHILDTPYDWDGTSNLIIELCYNNLSTSFTNNSSSPFTTTGYTSIIYYRSDNTPACPFISSQTTSNNRPNMQLTICNSPNNISYSWTPSTGLSNDTIADPIASVNDTTTYTVAITLGSCTLSDNVTINTYPTSLSATASSLNASCGSADGLGFVTVSGGSLPYTYLWNDSLAQTTDTATGLSAGVYSVSIWDSVGCQRIQSILVSDSGAASTSIVLISNITCTGSADGSATVSVTGGSPPFTYLWDDPGAQTNDTATGLIAGTHVVSVIDSNGCNSAASITIAEPLVLTASIMGTQVTCNGACDGSASTNVTGGTGPYTYLWDDPSVQSTAIANGLCAGTNQVAIVDSNGCTDSSIVIITEPVQLTSSTNTTNNTCIDMCDGNAGVSVSGGTTPYGYLWDDPSNATGAVAVGLCASTYTVTTTDAAGCILIDTVIIADTNIASISISGSTSCASLCDGVATVTIIGGLQPFVYLWDDPASQTNGSATGLCPGNVQCTITDSGGCSYVDSVIINSLVISITIVNVDAETQGNANGAATVNGAGGTAPYAYLWNDSLSQTNETATGLAAGTYMVTVTDANGCSNNIDVEIPQLVGLHDFTAPISFLIFPNPADLLVTFEITLPNTQDSELIVQDVLGKIVHRQTFQDVKDIEYNFNLVNIPNGVYFVQLQTEGEVRSKKFVISR